MSVNSLSFNQGNGNLPKSLVTDKPGDGNFALALEQASAQKSHKECDFLCNPDYLQGQIQRLQEKATTEEEQVYINMMKNFAENNE